MNVKVIKCFIASPSDVAEERKACDEVVDSINKSKHCYPIGGIDSFLLVSQMVS